MAGGGMFVWLSQHPQSIHFMFGIHLWQLEGFAIAMLAPIVLSNVIRSQLHLTNFQQVRLYAHFFCVVYICTTHLVFEWAAIILYAHLACLFGVDTGRLTIEREIGHHVRHFHLQQVHASFYVPCMDIPIHITPQHGSGGGAYNTSEIGRAFETVCLSMSFQLLLNL